MAEDIESPSDPRILVIVPAHNEAASLPQVVADLRTHCPRADIVVVDDASTDGSAAVAAGLGVAVLSLPCNLGVGGAVQTGFMFAAEGDYDLAVQFDGDGQHRANQIAALIEPLRAGRSDLTIGSRVVGGPRFRFHPFRFVGSRMLATLVSWIVRQRITDPTSGFRAANGRAIRFFARHYPDSYLADTVQTLAWAARQGLRITEVPARMRQRRAGHSATTSIRGVSHVLRITLALLVDCLEKPARKEEPPLCPMD
ncbi:MAG: glycosyltransferase family 2 protein [Planctomycetota bacterium]